jgi:hypothetical protein
MAKGMIPIVLVALFLVSSPLGLSDERRPANRKAATGNGWIALTTEQKLIWVGGFREGVEALSIAGNCETYDCFLKETGQVLSPTMTNGEVVDCVDLEFRDPTMRAVRIRDVIRYICKARYEGESASTIEEARSRLKQ